MIEDSWKKLVGLKTITQDAYVQCSLVLVYRVSIATFQSMYRTVEELKGHCQKLTI